MPRLSLWKPIKGNDYQFISRIVGEHLYAGGTGVMTHKYIGVGEVPDTGDPTQPGSAGGDELFIQDLLFLENRDRKYDKTIYEMRGQYNIQDIDGYELTQFGFFLNDGSVFMNFHIESMVEAIGRKLMPGDVLELPHLRDDLLLGADDALNRFYVVLEGSRPSEGFDPNWWPHLWRVKLGPISDSQEYRDLLGTGDEEDDLRNLVSKYEKEIDINDAILAQAENEVQWDPQYRDTTHLYFDPNDPNRPTIGFEFGAGGDQPPNGLRVVGSGMQFPTDAEDDDYFLRTDFSPNRLFRKEGLTWVVVPTDKKYIWAAAEKLLTTFINNTDTTTNTDGSVTDVKTNMSKVIRPKTDD